MHNKNNYHVIVFLSASTVQQIIRQGSDLGFFRQVRQVLGLGGKESQAMKYVLKKCISF